jgi:methionyl-tRNA formyltransferase
LKTVFLGSPPFALPVFRALARSRHRPLALVTAPDKPRGRGREVEPTELVLAARELGVEQIQPADPHADDVLAKLRELAPDVLVVASYGVILKSSLIDFAPHGSLNVHASLLPRWRGASPIQAAIAAGDERTGVSIQRIVRALDEGDVLLSKERAIGAEETSGELLAALAELGGAAIVEALDLLENGAARFTPQDASRATYARKLKKERGALDWTRPASELVRHVRAMNPWPGARALDPKGRDLTVLRAREIAARGEPGAVLEASERFVVACGENALELVQLTPAGKRPMSGADYLRGARVGAGERLTTPPPATHG